MNGFGPQTDAMIVAGVDSSGNLTAECLTYDGTNWATAGAYPAAIRTVAVAKAGTTSAGLAFGGTPPVSNATNEFNGVTTAAEASDVAFY